MSAGGLYLSSHHGRVGQERVSIGGELAVALTLRIKARCSEASVCADRCLIVVCRTALFRCSLRRKELSDSCIGVELDCSALLLAKPALVGICKEGFICRRTSLVVVGCCCKRSRCTRDSELLLWYCARDEPIDFHSRSDSNFISLLSVAIEVSIKKPKNFVYFSIHQKVTKGFTGGCQRLLGSRLDRTLNFKEEK